MKNLVFAILSAFILISCSNGGSSGGGISEEDVIGKWNLKEVKNTETGEAIELQECDLNTPWEFTDEQLEPLGDGTEVKKVVATAPEGCKWFGFDSKWTVKDGQLFISSSKIGGMGGQSHAGLFDIIELTENKMVLEILRHQYTLEK